MTNLLAAVYVISILNPEGEAVSYFARSSTRHRFGSSEQRSVLESFATAMNSLLHLHRLGWQVEPAVGIVVAVTSSSAER